MVASTLTDDQRESILKRFDNLSDPIVSKLLDVKFWSSLSAQTDILVKSNEKSLKNDILIEAIAAAGEAEITGSQISTKSLQQQQKKRLLPPSQADVTISSSPESPTEFTKNVIYLQLATNLQFFF